MTAFHRFLFIVFLIILIGACWLWWNRPPKVDMALYAPADSLVYLESNAPLNVVEKVMETDAWKALSPFLSQNNARRIHWLRTISAWTGIGSAQNVILARAQLAIVVLDLNTIEQGDTLKIRPEAAILIETHTGASRIRNPIEQALKQFAEKSYAQPTLRKEAVDGREFIYWSASAGDHQIVATIDGSLVIVGNSEGPVKACLSVRRGLRPNLSSDKEMQQMRDKLSNSDALAFGYVSSSNVSRLLSLGMPLLFGKPPGDPQFERLISSNAAKILGSVGWSSHASRGGIEDHYLFSIRPSILSRLRTAFHPTDIDNNVESVLPAKVHSLTIYKYDDPAAAWDTLESAITSQLDALSAALFTSVAKSALLPYGIDAPQQFLKLVKPQLGTARLDQDAERSVLIAGIRDEERLRELVTKRMGQTRSVQLGEGELIQSVTDESALGLVNGYALLGRSGDVWRCLQAYKDGTSLSHQGKIKKLTDLLPFPTSASVITYTNDEERVRNFISAIARANPPSAVHSPDLYRATAGLPYSVTETTLVDQGFERRTHSSFGQFSNLLPLLFPDEPAVRK